MSSFPFFQMVMTIKIAFSSTLMFFFFALAHNFCRPLIVNCAL